jgi:hypothetical protein
MARFHSRKKKKNAVSSQPQHASPQSKNVFFFFLRSSEDVNEERETQESLTMDIPRFFVFCFSFKYPDQRKSHGQGIPDGPKKK